MLASFLGNNGSFVARACHGANCINRVPEHDCDELNFVSGLSPEQVATPVALCLANTGQKLGLQHGLVGVGVLRLRISVPDSCDHCDLRLKRQTLKKKTRRNENCGKWDSDSDCPRRGAREGCSVREYLAHERQNHNDARVGLPGAEEILAQRILHVTAALFIKEVSRKYPPYGIVGTLMRTSRRGDSVWMRN